MEWLINVNTENVQVNWIYRTIASCAGEWWCDTKNCNNGLWYNPVPSLTFYGTHAKTYRVRCLRNLYCGTCEIFQMICECYGCTSILDKPWIPGVVPLKQILYQPVQYFTYWPVLGSFNNWNIITFYNKNTTSEDFEKIHKVIFDGINENMASLF